MTNQDISEKWPSLYKAIFSGTLDLAKWSQVSVQHGFNDNSTNEDAEKILAIIWNA